MENENVIPEIDISPLVQENSTAEEKAEVLNKLHTAFKHIGFMSIVGHGVPMELIERMERAGKDFFYLPKESKMSIAPKKWNPSNSNVYRGYFPATVFGKEGLDMSDLSRVTQTDPNCHLTEVNKFPDDFTDEQRKTFDEYFTQLHKLGVTLVKAVYSIYNADHSSVDSMFERPDLLTTLRLNYYPQHEEDYEASEISAQDGVKLACETHTDSVIITLLYQDLVGGLQVQCPWDKTWHDVPCNREAFVVNTGKALTRMTNGHYKSTFHRVLLGTKERLSIPFFFEPVSDVTLNPKILVPDEEPQYDSVTYTEHILTTNKTFKEYQR